jgi:hypothetical protein
VVLPLPRKPVRMVTGIMVVALFFKVEGSCGMFSGCGRGLRRLRYARKHAVGRLLKHICQAGALCSPERALSEALNYGRSRDLQQ